MNTKADSPLDPNGEQPDETMVINLLSCNLCEGGTMSQVVIRPYNVNVVTAMSIVGFLCIITHILAPIGLAMFVFGIYGLLAKKKAWLCDQCGAIVERG